MDISPEHRPGSHALRTASAQVLPAAGPPAAPLVPGYAVVRLLGVGASGAVWLVKDDAGKRFALKVPARSGYRGFEARREVNVLARLEHPHLVPLHGVAETDGGDGLLVGYAAGGSVAALVAARGPVAPGEAVTVLVGIAHALAYLHARGTAHGDVSPANVLFTAGGKPQLADFGQARLLGEPGAALPGTPGFEAPEVGDGRAGERARQRGLGAPADVYALAAVGWFLLTGRVPPPERDRPPLSILVPGVGRDLPALLEAGLAEDPAVRPTAAEVAAWAYRGAPPQPVDLVASAHPDELAQLMTRRTGTAAGGKKRRWGKDRGKGNSGTGTGTGTGTGRGRGRGGGSGRVGGSGRGGGSGRVGDSGSGRVGGRDRGRGGDSGSGRVGGSGRGRGRGRGSVSGSGRDRGSGRGGGRIRTNRRRTGPVWEESGREHGQMGSVPDTRMDAREREGEGDARTSTVERSGRSRRERSRREGSRRERSRRERSGRERRRRTRPWPQHARSAGARILPVAAALLVVSVLLLAGIALAAPELLRTEANRSAEPARSGAASPAAVPSGTAAPSRTAVPSGTADPTAGEAGAGAPARATPEGPTAPETATDTAASAASGSGGSPPTGPAPVDPFPDSPAAIPVREEAEVGELVERTKGDDPARAVPALAELRARAFNAADPVLLEYVDAPESEALLADLEQVERLRRQGRMFSGLRMAASVLDPVPERPGAVREPALPGIPGIPGQAAYLRVRLDVAPYYRVDAGGTVLSREPAVGQEVVLELVRSSGTWKISRVFGLE